MYGTHYTSSRINENKINILDFILFIHFCTLFDTKNKIETRNFLFQMKTLHHIKIMKIDMMANTSTELQGKKGTFFVVQTPNILIFKLFKNLILMHIINQVGKILKICILAIFFKYCQYKQIFNLTSVHSGRNILFTLCFVLDNSKSQLIYIQTYFVKKYIEIYSSLYFVCTLYSVHFIGYGVQNSIIVKSGVR